MQPDTGYIDQNPEDLRLTIVRGEVDFTQLHVYTKAQHTLSGITVNAAIIGASHVIGFSVGDYLLHEIFACVGFPDTTSRMLSEVIGQTIYHQPATARYEFWARRVTWQDPEPPEVATLVRFATQAVEQGGFCLVQEFPPGDSAVTPKTIIGGYADNRDGVVIETLHSYPNVRQLIATRTRFTRI